VKLLQVVSADGPVRAGILEGERVSLLRRPHEGVTGTLDLLTHAGGADAWLRSAERADAIETVRWSDLVAGRLPARLTMPLTPPEVWGAGVNDRVYVAERPELFFKATASRCAGPGEPIGRRRDSGFTASEPEVAVVVGAGGAILGYTLANDVSAWDIERDNPLYLPQSKVYDGCFSFGPVIVTPDEVGDPYALGLTCRVLRGGREVFRGSASTAQLKRRFPELVDWLRRSNGVPVGTVLSTGTGIIQPMDVGLEEGDVVTIACPQIGELNNPVALV
jgi:2-dehydro-3-deoxy-D-arabinonate dehydratase